MYQVIKRYGYEEGWSCTFRQHRAVGSHCRFLHGYPLSFEFKFECEDLDSRNWCLDFGGLKELKTWLQDTFDHKMLVAQDDPLIDRLKEMNGIIADIVIVPHVGCEMFARMAYSAADRVLMSIGEAPRVKLVSVTVSEHGSNFALYCPS